MENTFLMKNKRKTSGDKIFKDILLNKSEMAKFINSFIKYDFNPEQLEIYNTNKNNACKYNDIRKMQK